MVPVPNIRTIGKVNPRRWTIAARYATGVNLRLLVFPVGEFFDLSFRAVPLLAIWIFTEWIPPNGGFHYSLSLWEN